jgi:hypothetical protein
MNIKNHNDLILLLALIDTIHDFCNCSRIEDKITLYDSTTFNHIILGLIKNSNKSNINSLGFQNLPVNFFNNISSKIYNTKNVIWNKTISNLEKNIENHIIEELYNKKILVKEKEAEKLNINQINNTTINNIIINKNNIKLNIGVLNEDNDTIFYNKQKIVYLLLKKLSKKNIMYIPDANSIYNSDKFLCYKNEISATLYKGLFSLYDAGSYYREQIGGSSNDDLNLSINDNSNLSINNNIKKNIVCLKTRDTVEYSLKKNNNELLFVEELGVNKDENKMKLYRIINNSEKKIKINNLNSNHLNLSTFARLLSIVESTLENRSNSLLYFKEIINNSALIILFDIYQIRLSQSKKKYKNYTNTINSKLINLSIIKPYSKIINKFNSATTFNNKIYKLNEKLIKDSILTNNYNNIEKLNIIKNKLKIIINKKKKFIIRNYLQNTNSNLVTNLFNNIDKEITDQINLLSIPDSILNTDKFFFYSSKNKTVRDNIHKLIENYCNYHFETMNNYNNFLIQIKELNVNKIKLNIYTLCINELVLNNNLINEFDKITISPDKEYDILTPREFCLSLLDFKRSMDYLQVKACKASNDENERISNPDEKINHVFVSLDRTAILFGLLNNCTCIKTSHEEIKKSKKNDTILNILNYNRTYIPNQNNNLNPNQNNNLNSKQNNNLNPDYKLGYENSLNKKQYKNSFNGYEESKQEENEEYLINRNNRLKNYKKGFINNYSERVLNEIKIKLNEIDINEPKEEIKNKFNNIKNLKYIKLEEFNITNEEDKEELRILINEKISNTEIENRFLKKIEKDYKNLIQNGGSVLPALRNTVNYQSKILKKINSNQLNHTEKLEKINLMLNNNKTKLNGLKNVKKNLEDFEPTYGLDTEVEIDMLINIFSEELLFTRFLKIYKTVFEDKITVFMYITYHTLFFLIEKMYPIVRIEDISFLELNRIINKNLKI